MDHIAHTETWYIRDLSGNLISRYERSSVQALPLELKEVPVYGNSRMGIYNANAGRFEYEIKDHLGNVRLTITENSSHNGVQALTVTDYYPFGMTMPGRSFNSGDYRYSFNGFEQDSEIKGSGNHISWGDYGYDPRVVVRWSPDKLAAKYPWQSPYSVMGNNPILHKELDGKDYAVFVNHETKTVIVKATYYTAKGNTDDYNSAVAATTFWNEQSGKYQYKVGKGKEAQYYDIQFDLDVQEVDNPTLQVNIDKKTSC